MPVPRKKIRVAVHRKSGVTEIVMASFPVDMGDSGRVHYPITVEYFSPNTQETVIAKFSWSNSKNNNVVYREVRSE